MTPQTVPAPSAPEEFKFRQLLESAPDAIVITDDQGIIQLINRRAEELFRYPRAELLGQPIECLIPQRFHQRHVHQRLGYVAAPRTRPMGSDMELYGARKGGAEFPVEVSLSPLQYDDDLLIISVIRDVTERKRTQETLARQAQELARSNAELEQFAYAASHDLQEPLRMVTSYVQLLARRYRGRLDADADEFIQYAVDGAARMKALIEDLLAYSRVSRQGQAFAPTDCNHMLREVLEDLCLIIKETRADIQSEPLPTVLADAAQLRQLLQNLISNALKFRGEAAPHVHISARRDQGRWLFAVKDNGIGIAPEHQKRIFVIFQRLHRGYSGTGIGLAICERIVERHGGRIWVESQVGQGATFYFTIPLMEEQDYVGRNQ